MKKTLVILAAMLVTSIAAKAWKVGDFYANDPTGVPAIVAYVDESGEHGLIMSPQAYTNEGYIAFGKALNKNKPKFEKRAAKIGTIDKREDQFNIVMEWLKTAPRYQKLKKNKKNTVYSDVAQLNTRNGLENQKAVVNYCKEHNADLSTLFPEAHWASMLGEGWFIPGNHELELFVLHFANGLGTENKTKFQTWLDNHNEWFDMLGLLSMPSEYNHWIDPYALFPYYNLQSSTLQAKTTTEYYKLSWEMKFTFISWYFFINNQEPGAVVAFKYF